MSYKPLILLTFFTFPFSLLYIRLKIPQGTGSIFFRFALENLHPFRFAPSLRNFFRQGFVFRQADQTKNEKFCYTTWFFNYTCRTACSSNQYIVLLQYICDAFQGASPSLRFTPALPLTQKQVNTLFY
ncbi:hypothetical protein, partial [Bacillus wiedmannii]|uniref:hypothetical protein n=1 Tax=Bacillus wiedmannii TaxID=1890302 RepID=UPI001C54D6F4